jgi:hypothetical protein
VSGEQAATALGTGAIKPELPQTPSPFIGLDRLSGVHLVSITLMLSHEMSAIRRDIFDIDQGAGSGA